MGRLITMTSLAMFRLALDLSITNGLMQYPFSVSAQTRGMGLHWTIKQKTIAVLPRAIDIFVHNTRHLPSSKLLPPRVDDESKVLGKIDDNFKPFRFAVDVVNGISKNHEKGNAGARGNE